MKAKRHDIWSTTPGHRRTWLTPYLCGDPDAPIVIVCPGGSYFWLDSNNEAAMVGQWLNANGINAFVLSYHTAGVWAFITPFRLSGHRRRASLPLEDLQQAIALLRTPDNPWELSTTAPLGVMGFSAGGHNALLAGALSAETPTTRPDFIAAIYPVVDMDTSCAHNRSRRGLFGDFALQHPQLLHEKSITAIVDDTMPPVFVVHCDDDTTVNPDNSRRLINRLQELGIPCRLHSYPEGGHGFGANDDIMPATTRSWKPAFLAWLKNLFPTP